MRKILCSAPLRFFVTTLLFSFLVQKEYAQCGVSGFATPATAITANATWQNQSVGSGTYAEFNVVPGNIYQFRYTNTGLSGYSWDMTLSNASSVIAYNNDFTPTRDPWTGGSCPGNSRPQSSDFYSTFSGSIRVNTKAWNGACNDYVSGLGSAVLQYRTAPAASDPGAGAGVWNVEAFATSNVNIPQPLARYGYYVDNNLNFNSTAFWTNTTSPSSASTWVGTGLVPNDMFSIRARRTGFPCNRYRLVLNNANDDVRVVLNGTQLFSSACCISTATTVGDVNGYVLGATDNIEVRLSGTCTGDNVFLELVPLGLPAVNGGTIGGIANGTALCEGQVVGLFTNVTSGSGGANGFNGGGALTYSWEFSINGGPYSTVAGVNTASWNVTDSVPVGSTFSVRRVTTDRCGNFNYSNVINIIGRPKPFGNLSPTTQIICPGNSAAITMNFTQGTGPFNIQYYNGVSYISKNNVNNGDTFMVAPGTTTNYSFAYIQDFYGCQRSGLFGNGAQVQVIASPTVNAGSTITVCQSAAPSAITLSSASVGGSATTGAWSIISGGGSLSSTAQTATPANVTYTPAANFTGAVTLRLTTNDPDGAGPCSAVFQDRTIQVNQAATVVAGGPDVVCQSATPGAITLSGATIGGSATTGAWSILVGSGTLSSTAQTGSPATVTFTPTANFFGNVTLQLTTNDPDGAGPCAAVSASRTISVNQAATVIAGNTLTVCQSATPSAITLSGASVGGAATTGAWSVVSGGGSLSSTAQTATPANVTYTPAANFTGAVTLRLTTNDPDGAGPCTAISQDRTIDVNQAATAIAGGPDVACQSSNPPAITLSGSSVGGAAVTGAWSIASGGGSLSSTSQTANPELITYTPAANFSGTVLLNLTTNDPDGAGPCVPITVQRTITVNAGATVNAGGPNAVCQSDAPTAITLTGASFGGTASTAAWSIVSGGGTLSSTAQTATPATVTYTPAANFNGTVTLRLTTNDPDGAGPCTPEFSDRTITVRPLPVAAPSSNTPVCQGNQINLNANATGGGGTYGYVWSGPAGFNNGTASPSISNAQLNNGGTYNITVTDQFSCSSSASTNVVVNPSPNGSIVSSQSICFGASTSLSFNFNTGTGPFDVAYTDGTNTYTKNGVVTGDTIQIAPGSTATYTFTSITDANGCVRTTSFTAGAVVTVTPLPIINSATPTDVLCNGGNTGIITINASSGTPPLFYSIDSGSTYQSSNIFNGLVVDSYYVVVRDVQLCSTTYTLNPVIINEPTDLTHTTVVVDASCQNVFDGKITISASGGVGNYVYSLNGGPQQPGSEFTGLGAGTYTVYVFDGNGCVDTSIAVIGNSYSVTGSIVSQTNVSCFGGANGQVEVALAGGTPAYSYSLNGSAFSPVFNFTGLTAGVYVVALRDQKGCTDYLNVNISQPAQLMAMVDIVNNAVCFGTSTGEIFVSVTGGTAPYNYSWSNGASVEDVLNVAVGTYILTVTDFNGCTTSLSATVGQPLNLIVSLASFQNLKCFNDSTGSINISVGGGVPPYSYLWSSGATSEDLSDLHANTYTVTVTDNNGCQKDLTQTITQPPLLTSTINGNNLNCNGAGNGSVDLSPTGGTTPYSFFWNNGANTEDLTGVGAGTYSVIITDAKSCTAFNSINVTQPSVLNISASTTNIGCTGSTSGGIDVTVSGGTPTYTYLWSNGATSEDLTGVGAGTYTLTATDFNGCTATVSFTLSQPAQNLSGTLAATQVTCNGFANGNINLTVTGGTQPYGFLWSNGATTEDINGLSPNTYSVTITDANGCTFTTAETITQPQLLTASVLGTNVTCNGGNNGSADLTATGGTIPYTYLWSNFAVSEDISGLAAGSYSVIVTDSKNCTAIASTTITQPAAISISSVLTQVSCNGANSGAIDLTVTGGAGALTYGWSNGATTEDITSLVAGTYTVTVQDANLCTATATFTLTQPTALVLTATVTDVTCAGASNGKIDITVYGGVFPYTFLWSNGATTEDISAIAGGNYDVTVTDANLCTLVQSFTVNQSAPITSSITPTHVLCNGAANGAADLTVTGGAAPLTFLWSTFQSTEDISGLSGGIYYVIIRDANNCEHRDSVVITEPSAIVLSALTSNVSCNGVNDGSIDVTVNGGVSPYQYAWSNGASTEDVNGLAAGSYTVSVFDDNGCIATATYTITQPASLTVSGTATNVNCNGGNNGAINITVNGGTQPYTFNWSSGATTEDLSNLSQGTYSVVVTDANFCTVSAQYTVNEPAALVATISSTPVTCNGGNDGAADLTVTGGNVPYTYLWSTFSINEDLSNLTAGNYVVIVTDSKNCTAIASTTITQPAAIVLSSIINNLSCNGAGDGSIDLTVNGGISPYQYAWSNGASTEDVNGLAAGTYTVSVFDDNGCIATATYTITQPASLTVSGTATNVNCNGGSNGAINITVNGGTQPYTFNWSNGATTEDLSNLSQGTYSVVVTDANFCTVSATFTITQPAAITSSIAVTNVSCAGAKNGALNLTVSGGTAPLSFLWSTFQSTEDIAGLNGGWYYVIITDANGCTKRDSAEVLEPQPLVAQATATTISCNGGTADVTLAVTGGTIPYSFVWTNGATTPNLTGVSAGTYTVTITDANNCTATTSVTITQPLALALQSQLQQVTCNGGANGSINISVNGGTQPYSYNWSNGSTAEDQFALTANTYNLTITDANACSLTASFVITEPTALSLSVSSTDVTCPSAADGTATATITGGVTPYSFSWSNFQNTAGITGLGGGTYVVQVTDANGCTISGSTVVTEPQPFVTSASVTHVLCNGAATGVVDVTVSGATSPYTYLWSNGAATQDLNGVVAGTYVLTITDFNSCTTTLSATVNQPFALALQSQVQHVSCNGGTNGSISITVIGGVQLYSFAWSNGSANQNQFNLAAGTYTLTITDANNCSLTASFTLNQPGAITSNVVPTNVTCYGAANGSANLTVGGGTAPYSYQWSNFQISEDLQNVGGGVYYVLITDAGGCKKSDSVLIAEPAALSLTFSSNNITCSNANNGSIDLTVQGGTQPYTYLWSNGATTQDVSNLPGGTYAVTVTDANSCTAFTSATIANPDLIVANFITSNPLCFGDANGSINLIVTGGTPQYSFVWSNGATTEDISNLADGTYTVTITDSKGCTQTGSATLIEPSPLYTSGFITHVTCAAAADGFIDITGYGGTLPYSYTWLPGGQSTEDIGGIPGGNYTVQVTDANGCQVASLYIVNEPTPLNLSVGGTNISCFGGNNGTAIANVSGGTTPYTYLWDDFATTGTRNGLPAGVHSVMVTDSNGCWRVDSVVLTQPTQLIVSGSVTNANCFGAATGAIDVTVSGGNPAYTYLWSNLTATEDLSNILAGNYTVNVTDQSNCTAAASFVITEPTQIFVTLLPNQPGCNGSTNGSISAIATQGIPPYTYLWSTTPLQNTPVAANLGAGDYTITVTDANFCTATSSVTLNQNSAIVVTANPVAAKCFNTSTGVVSVTATGGVSPLTYQLNGITQTTNSFTGLAPGNYVVTVKDINGCEGNTTFTIAEASQISVSLTATEQVILTGMSVQLNASTTSTTSVISHVWAPVSVFNFSSCSDPGNCASPYVSPLSTTTFVVSVMNADSCVATDTVTVVVNNEQSKFIPTAFTPNGDGLNDRFEFDVLGATNLEVSIYNRWGQRVYYNESQPNGITGNYGWDGMFDGKAAPDDTYVYRITITYFNTVKRDIEGTVNIMR
ncbi:MAG: gliding motility-associated C-terminal domain-containing protein [Chitinophagales bacterium]|nr:gliding motility-associated C-terminal domain-containing protein [Chitinophagales bacterium]